MNKISYIQLSSIIMLVAIAGCAATSDPANPLGAAESSAQMMGSGAAGAATAAATSASMNQIGLVDILAHRLGVSPQQALGGAGAIFQAAQGNMDPQAFATLSKSIPGMDTMLGAAPNLAGAGGLSSLMGGADSTLGSVAALAGSFQQLDLSPDMVGKFIPVITDYVKQASGQATANLFQSALGVR
ncbi:MAG: DUF2780 domain-containing protein [Nitrosomonas sp.]|nr:MAG: DUF2780 domain-containing protein [Nitrosomonas sp.]